MSDIQPRKLQSWGAGWLAITCILLLTSCSQVDLYEKTVAIPGHAWKSSFKPVFTFTIKDTAASYQPYLILRHNDQYNFKNIYVSLAIKLPAGDTIQRPPLDLPLASDENGWYGEGMDDIYEHRIKLGGAISLKKGDYSFILEQVMREDPLKNVLDAGIRVEKVQ